MIDFEVDITIPNKLLGLCSPIVEGGVGEVVSRAFEVYSISWILYPRYYTLDKLLGLCSLLVEGDGGEVVSRAFEVYSIPWIVYPG